jgi:hypothetical protein
MGNWVADKPANYVKDRKNEETQEITLTEQSKALPSLQSIPITKAGRSIAKTPQMAAPPSATEHTTRQLSNIHSS